MLFLTATNLFSISGSFHILFGTVYFRINYNFSKYKIDIIKYVRKYYLSQLYSYFVVFIVFVFENNVCFINHVTSPLS